MTIKDNGAATPAAVTIAQFLATAAETVPDTARHAAARILLNGLRATLAARDEPLPAALRKVELGRGAGAAEVLFSGVRLPADAAALCNQQLWTLLLLDDMEMVSGTHPGGPAVTAALALAAEQEAVGTPVSGRRLLAAVVAGIEVQVAVALASSPEMLHERGFAPLSALAPLGAAATACVLLATPAAVTRHALGIAAMSGIGMWEMGGTTSAGYITAAATRSGISAVLAARAGFEAPDRAIDGDFGAFSAFTGKDRSVLTSELALLGSVWRTPDILFQPYSGDTYSQAPLAAVAEIRGRLDGPEGRVVEHIVVRVDARISTGVARKFARHPQVHDRFVFNSDPQSRVAAAWLRGCFSYDESFSRLVDDVGVRTLRERVTFKPDLTMTDMSSADVEIVFTDGSSETARVPAFRGSGDNPMSDEELAGVFRAVARGVGLPEQRTESIVATVYGLDTAGSVSPLLAEIG